MPEQKENVFMNSRLVDKLSKNMLEEIRISILTNDMVDVRTYFFFPQEPEPKPTKKGVWLSFKQLPDVIAGLDKLSKNIEEKTELELEHSSTQKLRVYSEAATEKKALAILDFGKALADSI